MTGERSNLWLFDRFEPGMELSTQHFAFDEERVRRWDAIFDGTGDDAPRAGPLLAMMMEAYVNAAQPRPAGNIHVGQKVAFVGGKLPLGSSVSAQVTCLSKEIRRNRRWIVFGVTLSSGGSLAMSGEMNVIWAA